jgi:hypothetical protein
MPVSDCEVGLLIGYDCSRALLPREIIAPVDDGPYAQRTDLGWGIVGITGLDSTSDSEYDQIGVSHRIISCEVSPDLTTNKPDVLGPTHVLLSFRNRVKVLVNPKEVAEMMELDFSEYHKSDKTSLSQEDQKFLTVLHDGIHMIDGHYEMPLPFKSGVPNLPNNNPSALHRFRQLQSKFQRCSLYRNRNVTFMNEMIIDCHAEKVPDTADERNDGCVWYIPHHGVCHP